MHVDSAASNLVFLVATVPTTSIIYGSEIPLSLLAAAASTIYVRSLGKILKLCWLIQPCRSVDEW